MSESAIGQPHVVHGLDVGGHETLVSVVVPVYQVEKYLQRCVESILAQTHSALQIILVDDGSTDSSPALCDHYAERDTRVAVIHQQNAGLGAARNRGIERADGAWITFVDSDDWIHPEMIEYLLSLGSAEVDVVVAQFQRVRDAGPTADGQGGAPVVLSAHATLENFLGAKHTMLTISCAKLFRTVLFADIRFPQGSLHEDEYTTYRLLGSARQVVLSDRRLYFYYVNPESITGSGLTIRHRQDLVGAFAQQAAYVTKKGYRDLAPRAQTNLLRKQLQLYGALSEAGEAQSAGQVVNEARATVQRIPWNRPHASAALLGRLFVRAPRTALKFYRVRHDLRQQWSRAIRRTG